MNGWAWVCLGCLATAATCAAAEPGGAFFLPERLAQQARMASERSLQVSGMRREVVEAARPWLAFSDDQLWEMMFGATIKRSWMVWSDGFCPACRKGVPMYTWVIEPLAQPWKARCPHCKELFPKNDFGAFYRSGMNASGVFDPARADRTLLYNAEHPDAGDPLRTFGVDDGEGFVAEGHRWRFVGAYLIYGQWKALVHAGILRLSAAYAVTGEATYAHKAGVLLDRVADLYPDHDFGKQGVMYEGAPRSGYVSTWHDACIETRQMALAYDRVREALAKDEALARYLAGRAKRHGIAASKATPADVLRNIESGILRHPQANPDRIYCNYPQTEMTIAILKSVLGGPGDHEAARAILDQLVDKATAVDGVTGEKGLTGYAAFATAYVADVLATYARSDPGFLRDMVRRHPRLADMFRFHIDTWVGRRFYPHIGDCGAFAAQCARYAAVTFTPSPGVGPSMFAFLWQLFEATGDPAFVQTLYHANGGTLDGLPHDLFAADPAAFRRDVAAVIRKHGAVTPGRSIDKQAWHLALLKAGSGPLERALWIDYDSGGYHSHGDALNIGLYAFGLDLLPDFGYPPVQFGGWGSERATWYTRTAAHNTVTVDGKSQRNLAGPMSERAGFDGRPSGRTTLWADGRLLRAVRAEAPEAYGIDRYERTVAMADVPAPRARPGQAETPCYVLDIFRVKGGSGHARMTYSGFGAAAGHGLRLVPGEPYGHGAQLRGFRTDPSPAAGWSVEWTLEDRLKSLPAGPPVRLRLTDLTDGASASLCEAWVAPNGYNSGDGEWIPALMARRQAERGPLESVFVSILEPYRDAPPVASARSLQAGPGAVALEVALADGRRDVWVAPGPVRATEAVDLTGGQRVTFDGDLLFLRLDRAGAPTEVATCGARTVRVGAWELQASGEGSLLELSFHGSAATLRSGRSAGPPRLLYKGRPARILPDPGQGRRP
jgi:hypothetical protein